MAYVGVRARTKPRQLFWPVGDYITLEARAFAKPFGGTIGPWAGVAWPQSALQSDNGAGETDAMVPKRDAATGGGGGNDPRRLPNYSRFPGDSLGLKSSLALSAMSGLTRDALKVSYSSFEKIFNTQQEINPVDILSTGGGAASVLREYEVAALAPDLFDITYYSIDPAFDANYMPKLLNMVSQLQSQFGLSGQFILRPDLGSSLTDSSLGTFSVANQIISSNKMYKSSAYYFVRDKTHLLTSWAPAVGTVNFTFPTDYFGKCATNDDNQELKAPGSCVAGGGRTGYSVKIVSRNYLISSRHVLGGQGGGQGNIANPPPADF
jgi:hypothetical protein